MSPQGPLPRNVRCAVSGTTRTLSEVVAQSREACGCVQCLGGYEIGARTVQVPDIQRPASCVARVVLAGLMNGQWWDL